MPLYVTALCTILHLLLDNQHLRKQAGELEQQEQSNTDDQKHETASL